MTLKHIFLVVCFLWSFCLLTFNSTGQTYQSEKIIPPSPTAASLGVYGSFPVNYYSGTTNVTLPLYEIKTKDHSLPITLNYFSTGLKVSENAGWAGLGWSLSAGGVITHTIVGMDDLFKDNQYDGYYTAPVLDKFTLGTMDIASMTFEQQQFFKTVRDGGIDTDPDIFSYNVAGMAGKFVLGKETDGSVIYMDEKNNLKIEYTKSSNKWRLTDARGYKYYLGSSEQTYDYNSFSTGSELIDNAPVAYFEQPVKAPVTTAWYLDSIVSPAAEVIKFVYESNTHTLGLVMKSESQATMLDISGGCTNSSPTCNYGGTPHLSGEYKTFSASRQETYDMTLRKIITVQGSVDFNVTSRNDIDYVGTNKPPKLSEIVIKDNNSNVLKKFTLYHSYFHAGSNWKSLPDTTNRQRLKLDSLIESGRDGSKSKPYVFSYFSPDDIPYKYGKAIDHWGYFNNKTANLKYIPAKLVASKALYLDGADRRSDTDVVRFRAGVLASVTYPTGGRSDFDYEMNEYSNLYGDDKFDVVSQSADAWARQTDRTAHLVASFDLTDSVQVVFTTRFKNESNAPDSYVGDYAHIYKDGEIYFNFWESNMDMPPLYSHPQSQTQTLVLVPGHYSIDVVSTVGFTTAITATWPKQIPVLTRKGGGLRIKTITNYVNGIKADTKKWLYTIKNDSTSGLLICPPLYDYTTSVGEKQNSVYNGGLCATTCYWGSNYICRKSSSIILQGMAANTGIVAYSKVTELSGENGENGKTEYYFTNKEDQVSLKWFPNLPGTSEPLNGKLITKLIYDRDGRLLLKSENAYANKERTVLKGIKIYPLLVSNPDPNDLDIFPIKYYNTYSNWIVLSQTKETSYAGTDSLVNTTKYAYNNYTHLNLTSTETSSSNGNREVNYHLYPQDYPVGTPFIDSLVSGYQIGTPIENVKFLIKSNGDTAVLSGMVNYYKTTKPFLLDQVKLLEVSKPLKTSEFKFSNSGAGLFAPDAHYYIKATFGVYDLKGNLQERTTNDDPNHVYLWGYNGQYPVADISGSTYNAVKAIIHTNILDNPASPQQLRDEINSIRTNIPGALVNTYTYIPMIGMSSVTDASGRTNYYEYDVFNRLKTIRDSNGMIIKQIDYKYQTTLNQ